MNILKWQINEDKGKLFKWFAASFLINLVLLIAGQQIVVNAEEAYSESMSKFMAVSFNLSILELAMLYAITRLNAPKVSRQRSVAFMMLPASHAGKFWMRVFFLVVICGVVWVLGFLFADALHVLISYIFTGSEGNWATPAMADNVQRMLLPTETPRQAVVAVVNAIDMSNNQTMSPDSIQALQSSMMGITENSLKVQSFAEAGWGTLAYGLSSMVFNTSFCLLCGALFRNVPWIFAFLVSLVLSAILIVFDFFVPIGMVGLAVLLTVLSVLFICLAYNIFKKTQVINNKLLNV